MTKYDSTDNIHESDVKLLVVFFNMGMQVGQRRPEHVSPEVLAEEFQRAIRNFQVLHSGRYNHISYHFENVERCLGLTTLTDDELNAIATEQKIKQAAAAWKATCPEFAPYDEVLDHVLRCANAAGANFDDVIARLGLQELEPDEEDLTPNLKIVGVDHGPCGDWTA